MIFRCYYAEAGAHTHCRIFAGPKEGALGKCGDLCMRNEEFVEFKRIMQMDFKPDIFDRNKLARSWRYDRV